ncbi:MAG: DegT/DnrJ/EryC1/StrS family aminotransferase, partial [Coraliomargarita sp.]
GAEPIFIDANPDTWTMDPDLLEAELDRLAAAGTPAKAVVPVDLYGQCCNYERIEAICARHGVPIVEDAAESLGSTAFGRPAGSFGQIGVFSFNGNKIITTSGGGMLLSGNGAWIERARYLSTQAREPVRHYEHRETGYNYRMSNVLAALGTSQLSGLDGRIARRKAHFAAYADALADLEGFSMMPVDGAGEPNYWLTCLLVGDQRDGIIEGLEAESIEARPIWKPLHLQPVFASCRRYGGGVAERLFAGGLCLPSGSGLTPEERQRVINTVRDSIG